jgi:hypothetical protein
MNYFAGLDVSVKNTSVCIVDEMGRIVREVKVVSEPEALVVVLKNLAYPFKRIGLEAGPLSALGACPSNRCSNPSESDSSLDYEQALSPLEYRSDAASAAECAGLRAEGPRLAVYR